MKNLIFAAILLLIPVRVIAEVRGEVVAVVSAGIKPFHEALEGFQYTCGCKVKKVLNVELENADLKGKILKNKPDLILSVGLDALSLVKDIGNVAIVYVMVVNPGPIVHGRQNITGVSMSIPPQKQLYTLQKTFPEIKRIGLVYDPGNTGQFIKEAVRYASSFGITLIAREVFHSGGVPTLIESFKGGIDALWVLPDRTIMTAKNIEFFFHFSLKNKIPVISFARKYMAMGALISLSINTFDLGKQAGETGHNILSGISLKKLHRAGARKIDLSVNTELAKKLGIFYNDTIKFSIYPE